jgi:hypothetical protein
MLMSPDENDPFEYGDRTIFNLRAQAFQPDEDFGTMILHVEPKTDVPVLSVLPVLPNEDPIARLEAKLDAAMRKLDSIDATLARLLSR